MGNGVAPDTITSLFSIAVLVLIPQFINAFKESLKAKQVVPVGAALGQAAGSSYQTVMQLASTAYYLKNLKGPKLAPPQPKQAGEQQEQHGG